MRKILLGAWLVLPLGAWAYHEGPGQDRMALDEVDRLTAEANDFVSSKAWSEAIESYDAALKALPEDQTLAAQRIRLERCKAQMQDAKLPTAHDELIQLVEELAASESTADAGSGATELLSESRSALAQSRFYITWLMRLEGQPREKWEPEIEAARQTYRLLAEQAKQAGSAEELAKHTEDLESSIRLARLELKELQGLPLPNQ